MDEDNYETYATIKLAVERDENITDDDLAGIDIDQAIIALDEALPELPEGAKWHVIVNE